MRTNVSEPPPESLKVYVSVGWHTLVTGVPFRAVGWYLMPTMISVPAGAPVTVVVIVPVVALYTLDEVMFPQVGVYTFTWPTFCGGIGGQPVPQLPTLDWVTVSTPPTGTVMWV